MAQRRGVQVNVRLDPDLREQLRAKAEALGRTETWPMERGLDLILVDPDLTPEVLAEIRAQLVAARQEIERLTTAVDAANTRFARSQMENQSLRQRLRIPTQKTSYPPVKPPNAIV